MLTAHPRSSRLPAAATARFSRKPRSRARRKSSFRAMARRLPPGATDAPLQVWSRAHGPWPTSTRDPARRDAFAASRSRLTFLAAASTAAPFSTLDALRLPATRPRRPGRRAASAASRADAGPVRRTRRRSRCTTRLERRLPGHRGAGSHRVLGAGLRGDPAYACPGGTTAEGGSPVDGITIGARLRTLRRWRGMTQTQVAGLAGLSPSFLSMVETGQRRLTGGRISGLSRVPCGCRKPTWSAART